MNNFHVFTFLRSMCRSTKPKKVYHCECGWYFDNLHCNEVGRDPQAKLAKPNWRSDCLAGAQVRTSLPSNPDRHAAQGSVSDLWVEENAAVSTAVRSGWASHKEV